MYTLVRDNPAKVTLARQAVPMASALITAEFLYKFHSFTLECLAFLATWFVFDWVLARLKGDTAGANS
jgi:hypothetical protein